MASTPQTPGLYKTDTLLTRNLDVCYPVTDGRIVLRTEVDWDRDVEAEEVSPDGTLYRFRLEAKRPFLYFKACLKVRDEIRWAVGSNSILLMTTDDFRRVVYPQFFGSDRGQFSPVVEIPSRILGRTHLLRAYLPPGYEENTLKKYPIIYMQDGKNLFFPEDAFLGRSWGVNEALELLSSMSAVDKVVVVGLYSGDRMHEYTKPGYEDFARSIVEEVHPEAERRLRLLGGPRATGVMGSSLGGVVSFYMAWQYPQVFGHAACLSSTFSFKDDLMERVLSEPWRDLTFYLDSGWPGDNFEVTAAMAVALTQRGWAYGRDLVHLAFPLAEHDEKAWGSRLHLPLQLFWGKIASVSRALLRTGASQKAT